MKRLFALSTAFLISFSILGAALTTNCYAVQMDNWAKPAYSKLEKKHIIPLSLKGEKDLRNSITREEFAELIMTYLLSNKHYDLENYKSKFKDCDNKFVNLASALGITSGYSDGTFKPAAVIQRIEAAVMAYKVEELLGAANSGSVNSFKDAKSIPNWAKKAVGSMASSGAIAGFADGNFKPYNTITRQEAIAIVSKLSDGKKNKFNDVFDIEKSDDYMDKEQYAFVLDNIPTNTFTKQEIKQCVFDTDKAKKENIYKNFIALPSFTDNKVIFSPNLVFDNQKSTYMLGIEERVTDGGEAERRTVLITLNDTNFASKDVTYSKDFGSWFSYK